MIGKLRLRGALEHSVSKFPHLIQAFPVGEGGPPLAVDEGFFKKKTQGFNLVSFFMHSFIVSLGA